MVRGMGREAMSAPKPSYSATSVTMDVSVFIEDTWESRLLENARRMRDEWMKNKRRMCLMIDLDGSMLVFGAEPMGRIDLCK